MKILLLNPPALNYIRGVDYVRVDVSLPPIGIAYLSSYLKSKGIKDVNVFDLAPYSLESALEIIENDLKDTDILGISCFTDRRASVFKLIKIINNKYPSIEIVLGGAHPTFLYEQILNNFPVSAIFVGESEISFFNFIQRRINNNSISDLKGIAFKDENGKIVFNGYEELITNLDDIPFPDLSDFNLDFYRSDFLDEQISWNKKKFSQLRQFGIITSRGCPYKCQYCSTASFWKHKVRFRSVDNVIDEIKLLINNYGIEYILFLDDSFSIKPSRVIEICKKIIDEKLNFMWSCITRVESVSDEMLQYMQKANCCSISFGVESGSPLILNNINKRNTIDDVRKAFELLKKYNIKSNILLMVGNYGETSKTINETINLLKEIKPDSGGWGITTVFPGTELYNISLQNNYLTDDYWLSNKPSPYFCLENKYYKLKWWVFKIQAFFLIKEKKYKLLCRYFLLTLRDIFWILTGIKITKNKIILCSLSLNGKQTNEN